MGAGQILQGANTVLIVNGFMNTSSNPAPVLDWRLNDGSGSSASDSSGNGLNGTWSGTPVWGSGYADILGPTTRFITRAVTGLPTGTGAKTILAWASNWTAGGVLLGFGDNVGTGTRIGIYRAVNSLYAEGNGIGRYGAFSDWANLHCYAVTVAAGGALSSMRAYVDGVRKDDTQLGSVGTINPTAGEFVIGRLPTTSYEGITAYVHRVAVWNLELSAEQLLVEYASGVV